MVGMGGEAAHDDPSELTSRVPEGYRFAYLACDLPYGTEWDHADKLTHVLPQHP